MVESNPTVPLRSIQDQVQKRLQVGVSIHKVQRAKATATKQVTGDYTKQYEVLRDYLMELQATNVDTTVKLEVVNEPNSARETRQFKSRPGRAGSYILLNNLCEVFNSKLIHGMNKPIISCLEYIRQYLMKRIYNVKKVMSKALGPLTPTTSMLLERNKEASVQYRARWNGTAKRWKLNGIPCRHAIATIHEMDDSGDKVGELYTYVNKVYWLQTWNEAYSYTVEPIKGRAMWPKSTCRFQLTPPPHHIQPGRPKTKRKRSAYEKYDSQMHKHGGSEPEKLTRKFVSVKCGKCNNRGHNSRTCKGEGGNAGSK
ncbi:uncharacterized protein LOC111917790 [Lactuca sativa]|uniref:uncharacterized protein LOC111917790 n=1 Tax=Lactuca sativa TaxID=4236 RepID=UPI000CD87932|nr:uncharacterized protein LOC111917790 [Lactuca sativa]